MTPTPRDPLAPSNHDPTNKKTKTKESGNAAHQKAKTQNGTPSGGPLPAAHSIPHGIKKKERKEPKIKNKTEECVWHFDASVRPTQKRKDQAQKTR